MANMRPRRDDAAVDAAILEESSGAVVTDWSRAWAARSTWVSTDSRPSGVARASGSLSKSLAEVACWSAGLADCVQAVSAVRRDRASSTSTRANTRPAKTIPPTIQPHGVDDDEVTVRGCVVELEGSDVVVEDAEVLVGASVKVGGGSVVDVGAAVVSVVDGCPVMVAGGAVVAVGVDVVVATAGFSVLVGGTELGVVAEGPPVVEVGSPPPPDGIEGVVSDVLGRLTEGCPDPEPPQAASTMPAISAAARAVPARWPRILSVRIDTTSGPGIRLEPKLRRKRWRPQGRTSQMARQGLPVARPAL
jgi:hypothetical protein